MQQRFPASGRPRVANFGRNVTSRPQFVLVPRSEEEVLQILAEHRGRRIRAIGRLHSWSGAVECDEVLVDLRHLRHVRVSFDSQGPLAEVGAGCQIKRLLAELARHGLTMRTLGLVTEQTIAGATATGTHGSGRHSLSHYLERVRLAHYDAATGRPVIRVIEGGRELAAARCSLGCLGIVLSVAFRPRPAYRIEEWMAIEDNLDSVLAAEAQAPLTQFYFVPWLWKFLVQHRREHQPEAPARKSPGEHQEHVSPLRFGRVSGWSRGWSAWLYRWYWFLVIDVGFHLILRFLVQVLSSGRLVQAFYRHAAMATVIHHWHVVDDSAAMLVMEHELFRHIEIEVFVKRSDLAQALVFLRELMEHGAGNSGALAVQTRRRLEELGLGAELEALAGAYVHHYVVCVRRVLPDDTLLSMTAGDDEPRYALSLISYALPRTRDSFFRFAGVAARGMAAQYGARPHWGKVMPLDADAIESLYPRLAEFRAVWRQLDPNGLFANRWCAERLGLTTEDLRA
jgi:FAD/FMN-containing dehydrogenase